MNLLTPKRISNYTNCHFEFIKRIYFNNNSKNDLPEGRNTFINFIGINTTNKRIKDKSIFYEVKNRHNELVGIFELEDSHLTLLYVKNDLHKKGIGSFCLGIIKDLLKSKYNQLTVFSTPSSLIFYHKQGFLKVSKEICNSEGIRYYHMRLLL